MKESEKRYTNSYKCTSIAYNKAMRRAKKEKGTLSKLLELVVIAYGYGMDIKAHKKLENGASALDVFSNVKGRAENYIKLNNQANH